MVPVGEVRGVFELDAEGVAWVEVGEGGGEFTVFEGDFVATVGGVEAGAGVVEDDPAVWGRGDFEPEGEGERLGAADVAGGWERDFSGEGGAPSEAAFAVGGAGDGGFGEDIGAGVCDETAVARVDEIEGEVGGGSWE